MVKNLAIQVTKYLMRRKLHRKNPKPSNSESLAKNPANL
ncbi:hypothetical protein EV11_0833 [Prochlorococcus sp. SS52]|nr:hypothetical protein EV04_0663 [Prochlorococcus marinus str. LG]KGG21328.1 hypothetical protein EV08_0736 [Prochlorococcus marinus str. SS2]KGG24340.1 hypothetical protein EV09_0387 [Prochlorococcus marinus str. SS35]KGG33624.1 hypothetical protein EV10_0464 [Prochlorococcus marinus str. SS51]KGG36461.1 hypothetical protein EV11_0833 [Prochlorococcus sp. SS52]